MLQNTVNLCSLNELGYRKRYIFVSCRVLGIEKKRVWGKGNIPISSLNNFSEFFWKKIAIFVTLKKVTRLNFQSNLKKMS